jgi:hypothetical protein
MLHTKLIRDFSEIGLLVFPPPYALVESIEDAEQRGEKWWVIMAYERNSDHAQWVSGFPGARESQFYSEDGHLSGRWDREHEIFIPKEGPSFDLRGKPVSLSSIIEREEEETAEQEEKNWNTERQSAQDSGSLSWDQGEV